MMKLKKPYSYIQFGALVLMAAYLLIVVSHLFFAPQFQTSGVAGRSPVVKKNTESLYYLIRNDRSTFSENKTAKTFPRKKSFFSISFLINQKTSPVAVTLSGHFSQFLPDYHHSYLSNRVMRI